MESFQLSAQLVHSHLLPIPWLTSTKSCDLTKADFKDSNIGEWGNPRKRLCDERHEDVMMPQIVKDALSAALRVRPMT